MESKHELKYNLLGAFCRWLQLTLTEASTNLRTLRLYAPTNYSVYEKVTRVAKVTTSCWYKEPESFHSLNAHS